MKIKKIILDHLNMSEFEQDFIKPNRQISFNEKVHVFDMSKPAPSPKSPKRSKIITPILKQSPNTSSDEECDYLPPTYKQTQPIYKQREPDCKQSRNTGTMRSKAFLDEVISELKNHQQKVNNDLVSIPIPQKQETEKKSYGHRRSPSSHDFFKSQMSPPNEPKIKQTNQQSQIQRNLIEDQVINSTEKYQVVIDITGCKKDEIQIKAKENVLSVDGKLLEVKPDGTKVTISFSKRFNLPNDCQMSAITSNVSNNQLLITAPKKTLVKTGFRSVPIMFSQENSKDDKKQKSPEQHTERLGRKLSKLGQKYSEIDQSIEKEEKPKLKNDRIFGIRHGQNMKPIEMPGFDFQPQVFKFENGFQNLDDLKKDFENDFQNGFNAYKWDSFHDELMKPNSNAAVTTVPIVLTENSPGSKPKFGSCHSQEEGDFSEIENSRFHIKPAQRQDKFRNIQRVPIENRANFKNENLEENIIKASKLASANQPWFQSGFENNSDFKGVKVSSL